MSESLERQDERQEWLARLKVGDEVTVHDWFLPVMQMPVASIQNRIVTVGNPINCMYYSATDGKKIGHSLNEGDFGGHIAPPNSTQPLPLKTERQEGI
jgi:hypothetical protein